MKFTVIWKPSAERELAQIWDSADANDRRDITIASNAIDHQLAESAERAGESRGGNDRIHFEPPLGIRFRVSVADRMVVVLNVWRTQ